MKRIIFALFSLFALIALLVACAGGSGSEETDDLDQARQTLIDFFALLSSGDYQAVAELHAENPGLYEWLQQNNPDVDPTDRAALLEAGCTFQLVCMEIKQVLSSEQVSDTLFNFSVEFANEDGSTFVLGPCCGQDETSMPPTSAFDYQVEKAAGQFLVIGWPVYVP